MQFEKEVIKDREEKKEALLKAIKTFESDEIELRKIYELLKSFKNSEEMAKALSKLKTYKEGEFYKSHRAKIEEIEDYLDKCEEKGLTKTAKSLIENEHKIDNLPYARHYIERYVESDKIFTKEFLEEEGLDESAFKYFVETVDEYDGLLYTLYNEKRLANSRDRRYMARSNIRDLYSGITTGKTRIGMPFDKLTCYELLPFKTLDNLNELIEDFGSKNGASIEQKTRYLMEKVEPDMAATVYKYLIENRIITKPYNFTTIDEFRRINVIVNGKEVADEDKDVVVKYLRVREVPLFNRAVTLVRDKVLNKEIYLDEEKNICIKRLKK